MEVEGTLPRRRVLVRRRSFHVSAANYSFLLRRSRGGDVLPKPTQGG